jgi:hypothetical protein
VSGRRLSLVATALLVALWASCDYDGAYQEFCASTGKCADAIDAGPGASDASPTGLDAAQAGLDAAQPGLDATTVLFSDDFSGAGLSPLVAHTSAWDQTTWTISGGTLELASGATGFGSVYYQDATWTDYTVSATVAPSQDSMCGVALDGRLQSAATGARYEVTLYPNNSSCNKNEMILWKPSDWDTFNTQLNSAAIPVLGANQWVLLQLTFSGHTIRACATPEGSDAGTCIAATDNSSAPYLTGGVGLTMSGGTTGTMLVKDLKVTP